jgi:hypothetical protein
VAQSSKGQPANLSDLTLTADGKFTYGGQNALGGPVKFAGTYNTGRSDLGPWIQLVFADYTDRQTVWYYTVSDKELAVSAIPGNLKNGSALVFTRQ